MKTLIKFKILLVLMLLSSFGCQNSSTNASGLSEGSSNKDTSLSQSQVPKRMGDSLIVRQEDSFEKKNEEKSIFKKLGCCADRVKRNSADCCCKEVLAAATEIYNSNLESFHDIQSSDPIYKNCRDNKLYQAQFKNFEKLDNEEDDY